MRSASALLVGLGLVLAGCSLAGGLLGRGHASPEEPTMTLALSSPAFLDGQPIPRRHGCDDADVSPALRWQAHGLRPAEWALVVRDPDARGFVHWAVAGIPSEAEGLPEGAGDPSSGSLHQGPNDFGRRGWGGPCPPRGVHRYVFTLFALAEPLDEPRPSAERIERARALTTATLTGTFER